jgi:uncharacterized protein (DUF433 family)
MYQIWDFGAGSRADQPGCAGCNGSRGYKCRQRTIHFLDGLRPIPTRGPGSPAFAVTGSPFQEILEWLSSGASQQQILADYPRLEQDGFLAVYAYAADLVAGG